LPGIAETSGDRGAVNGRQQQQRRTADTGGGCDPGGI
jgi:hypothetical protein